MKKISIIFVFIGISSFSFAYAQALQKAPIQFTKNTAKPIANNSGIEKAPGIAIWTNDF